MKKILKYLNLIAFACITWVLLAGCSGYADYNPPELSGLNVKVESHPEFGNILVNHENRTLYFFAGDAGGKKHSNEKPDHHWQALTGELDKQELGEDLDLNDFASISLTDGRSQITYKGWPLYYFSPKGDGVPEEVGETLGDGEEGLFHVAKPDYTVLIGKQTATRNEESVIYLVNDRGVGLYHTMPFAQKEMGTSDMKEINRPPFRMPEQLVIPSSLNRDDFNFFFNNDQVVQLSYQGNPLYYFSRKDERRSKVGSGKNKDGHELWKDFRNFVSHLVFVAE